MLTPSSRRGSMLNENYSPNINNYTNQGGDNSNIIINSTENNMAQDNTSTLLDLPDIPANAATTETLSNELRQVVLSVKQLLMNKEMQAIESNYLKNAMDSLKQAIADVSGKYKQFDDEFELLHRNIERVSKGGTILASNDDENPDELKNKRLERNTNIIKAIEEQIRRIIEFKAEQIAEIPDLGELIEQYHSGILHYIDAVEGGEEFDKVTQILHNLVHTTTELYKYNDKKACPLQLSLLFCDDETEQNILKYINDTKDILSEILTQRCDIWSIVSELKNLTISQHSLIERVDKMKYKYLFFSELVSSHIIEAGTRNKQIDTTLQSLATLVKKANGAVSGMQDDVRDLKKKKIERKDLQYLDSIIVELTKKLEESKIDLQKRAKSDFVQDEFDKIYEEISFVKNSIESVNEVSNKLDYVTQEMNTKLDKEAATKYFIYNIRLIHQIVPKPKSWEIKDENVLLSKYRCISCNRPIPVPLRDNEQLENIYTENGLGANDQEILELRDNLTNPNITKKRIPNNMSNLANYGDEDWDKDVSQGKPSAKNVFIFNINRQQELFHNFLV